MAGWRNAGVMAHLASESVLLGSLLRYLRTRCVEAVVHGMDLHPPVVPDPVALAVTVDALMDLLRARAPARLAAARALSVAEFVDVATGRAAAPAALASVMPLVS